MRATLIFTALFICAFGHSQIQQNVPYAQVVIWNISPDTVCAGDSIKAYFKFVRPTPITSTLTNVTFQSFQPEVMHWLGNYNEFYGFKKEHYTGLAVGDSCYTIMLKVPDGYPVGLHTLYGNAGQKRYYSKDCRPAQPVGIEEISPSTIEPEYYDFNGNRIEKRYNQVIIQKTGTTRKKVLICQ